MAASPLLSTERNSGRAADQVLREGAIPKSNRTALKETKVAAAWHDADEKTSAEG